MWVGSTPCGSDRCKNPHPSFSLPPVIVSLILYSNTVIIKSSDPHIIQETHPFLIIITGWIVLESGSFGSEARIIHRLMPGRGDPRPQSLHPPLQVKPTTL